MRHHQSELQALLLEVQSATGLRREPFEGVDNDFSMTESSSFYIPGSLAAVLHWDFGTGRRSGDADWMMYSTVIENALLQYWQLRMLDALIGGSTSIEMNAVQLQTNLIFGLQEYGRSELSYGSAADISTTLLKRLGGDMLFSRVHVRAELLRELLAARQAARSSIRSTRLSAAAFVAAIILGLPAIHDALTIATAAGLNLPRNGSVLTYAVVTYICLMTGAFLLLLLRTPRHLREYKRPRYRRDVGIRPAKKFSIDLYPRSPKGDT